MQQRKKNLSQTGKLLSYAKFTRKRSSAASYKLGREDHLGEDRINGRVRNLTQVWNISWFPRKIPASDT